MMKKRSGFKSLENYLVRISLKPNQDKIIVYENNLKKEYIFDNNKKNLYSKISGSPATQPCIYHKKNILAFLDRMKAGCLSPNKRK